MSQVRMCDKCGIVFPTNGYGETSGTVVKTVRENGATKSYNESVDYCPDCSGSKAKPVVNMLETGWKGQTVEGSGDREAHHTTTY